VTARIGIGGDDGPAGHRFGDVKGLVERLCHRQGSLERCQIGVDCLRSRQLGDFTEPAFGRRHLKTARHVDDAVSKKEKAVLTARVTSVTPAEAVSLACCSRGRYGKCAPPAKAGRLLLHERACSHHVRSKTYSDSSGVDYADLQPTFDDLFRSPERGQGAARRGHVLKARKDGAWCLQVLARRLRLRLL
jgi:hypothetical protein